MTLLSCNQKKDNTYQEVSAFSYDPEEAKELMEKHCYLCHSPIADELEGRIAPPMVAIKARYIDKEGKYYDKSAMPITIKQVTTNASPAQSSLPNLNSILTRFPSICIDFQPFRLYWRLHSIP